MELLLDAPLTAGLKALSHRHGTTLYMTLLAGWSMFLARLSGSRMWSLVLRWPIAANRD